VSTEPRVTELRVAELRVTELQAAKQVVLDYYSALDAASGDEVVAVIASATSPGYSWRGVHPFHEQSGAEAAAKVFWQPLRRAMAPIQRRPQVFMAGHNDVDDGQTVWVCQMGQLLGLFDRPWLDIPPTGKMVFLRYAEFHRVQDGRIAETALFCDIPSVMVQAGHNPFPPQTGADFIHPGPRTGDGVLTNANDQVAADKTMALVNEMVADLSALNKASARTGDDHCPPEHLARTWHDDMIWYGPTGIGASYTINRYQEQHQYPFRLGLADKVFNGHVARFAEADYAGFFGWPNLSNTPRGGFLGMPGGDVRADMRVVDIYRRQGDKLAENWVFIDLLHWLSMQGLDVLDRMRQLNGLTGPDQDRQVGQADGAERVGNES